MVPVFAGGTNCYSNNKCQPNKDLFQQEQASCKKIVEVTSQLNFTIGTKHHKCTHCSSTRTLRDLHRGQTVTHQACSKRVPLSFASHSGLLAKALGQLYSAREDKSNPVADTFVRYNKMCCVGGLDEFCVGFISTTTKLSSSQTP